MTSSNAGAGIGLATVHEDGTVLEVWFPHCSTDPETVERTRAAAGGASVAFPDGNPCVDLMAEAFDQLRAAAAHPHPLPRTTRRPVIAVIDDLALPPTDTVDVYLRLSLLSHRHVLPHGLSVDGAFGLLSNNAWTDLGPVRAADLATTRLELAAAGTSLLVRSVDKFPRMVDHVVPSGVRIGDADRVRLGAHLAHGTTVMHEGFVNFNAGTLGAAMIEGRISAGVVIGNGSDLGGSASVMGTLSGGGSEVISIGEGCLVGANAGIGISLGDGCIVEAGLYVTGGTKVTLPDGSRVAARKLSGADDLLFRRNSVTGAVEAIPRSGEWGELNAALHAN